MRLRGKHLSCGVSSKRGCAIVNYSYDARGGRRRGFTLLELSVAAAMLCALVLIAVQMFRAVTTQQQAAERRALALETVQAVAEQIGNMRWDELTLGSVESISAPASATAHLPGAKLAIGLEEENEPVAAKRITIELTWNNSPGRSARPVRLTSWVFDDER